MEMEVAKNLVLKRLYEEGFQDYDKHNLIDLMAVAAEYGIDPDMMVKLDGELDRDHFYYSRVLGMRVSLRIHAIIYCEEHGLVDRDCINKQRDIRKRILEICADCEEEKPNDLAIWGEEIFRRAGISCVDFYNNVRVLEYIQEMEQLGPFERWRTTPEGRSRVRALRKRRKWLLEFRKLKEGKDVTPQKRGHKIEDLLAEIIADEGWQVSKRIQTRGAEQDLIINKDRDYFLISSKWEKAKTGWRKVDTLINESMDAGCYSGIMVSMSGYTDKCLTEVKGRKKPQKIVLFGPNDVESLFSHAEEIFSEKQWFSDLLDEKIKKLIHQNKMLVDGVSN